MDTCMVLENSHGLTEQVIRANITMEENMERVLLYFLEEKVTKDYGRMAVRMGMVFFETIKIRPYSKEFGGKESSKNHLLDFFYYDYYLPLLLIIMDSSIDKKLAQWFSRILGLDLIFIMEDSVYVMKR